MQYSKIEQKGMTFDYDFCLYSHFLFSFFAEGRERVKRITKAVVKRHAFLLDHIAGPSYVYGNNRSNRKDMKIEYRVEAGSLLADKT